MRFFKSLTKSQMENIIKNIKVIGVHGELVLENTEEAREAVKCLYPNLKGLKVTDRFIFGIKGENI